MRCSCAVATLQVRRLVSFVTWLFVVTKEMIQLVSFRLPQATRPDEIFHSTLMKSETDKPMSKQRKVVFPTDR